jgi:hypothetical protein
MIKPPDFFIAGAAKCGTTALFEYLSGHPSVFMPSMKEPKYFCSDVKTTGGVYSADEYAALFGAAPAGSLTGEASTLYLYSQVAIERIMQLNPSAKIIVMLRYPVDAAHSLHAARWAHGHENIADFEEAWHAQGPRLSGARIPPRWPDAATLQYGSIYRYAPQVKRLMERVPENQRHIVIYEDLFANSRHHYAQILEFLNLAADGRTDFPIVNPAMGFRSRRLEQILRQPPPWLKAFYAPLRPIFHIARLNPSGLMWRLNSTPSQKSKLRPAFRAELQRYFAPDIEKLEGQLGRPLWRDDKYS